MIMNLVCGVVAIAMVVIFMGIMVWWVPAPPLIIICVVVLSLLLYDFVQTLRFGRHYAQRK